MSQPVYTASSSWAFCLSIAIRLLALSGFMWLFGSYDENPVLIVIAMIICLLIFFYWGNEEILLYHDRLVIRPTSLAYAIFSSGHRQWMLKDLQQIEIPREEPPGAVDMGLMMILSFLVPRRGQSHGIPLWIELKDGTVLKLSSELSEKKLRLLSTKANELIENGRIAKEYPESGIVSRY
jgi:hypothetical protein